MTAAVCSPSDYIIYHKDLSLEAARIAPAVVPPKPRPTPFATGPGSLCGVACNAAVESYDFPTTGRGLRTTRSIKQGEAVVAVPLEQCWTAERARNCPALASFHALPDEDMMALHLLVERSKGDQAWNAAHIESLPKTFDMTVNWSQSELSELDADLQDKTRRLAAQLEGDFNVIVGIDAEASRAGRRYSFLTHFGVDLEAYKWAKGVLWSRCTDLAERKGGELHRFLCPGFDLANHDALLPSNHVIADGKIQLKATKDYKEGEEFCLNYGRGHANQHLIMWYGFVLDENPFNGPTMEFPVDEGEAAHLKSIGAVMRDGDPGTVIISCTLTFSEPLPPALVFAAALCNGLCKPGQQGLDVAQELEALDLLKKIVPAGPELPPLPPHSEYRRRCAAVLQTIDDRVIVAFHEAVGKRILALEATKTK